VIGTTDVKVDDPDRYAIEPWEMGLMLDEGEKLLPGLKDMRILRAWAGVRPLYQAVPAEGGRSVSRGHALLDHAARDGVAGMLTIVGGKWTTYRLMAQDVVDRACVLLGTRRECRTHLEQLPAIDGAARHHFLGTPLARAEEASAPPLRRAEEHPPCGYRGLSRHMQRTAVGELVCECELATRADVERSIATGEVQTIDDIRRDVRLGMGPCQGGFCTYRAAGILHVLRRPPAVQSGAALRDFLQERWKGLRPVMSGDQLRQTRLTELIYRDVLNVDRLDARMSSAK
jgi:glycerol-3-phosphate dehydrogenase